MENSFANFSIQRCQRIVEQVDLRLLVDQPEMGFRGKVIMLSVNKKPCKGDPLLLASTQVDSILPNFCLVSSRHQLSQRCQHWHRDRDRLKPADPAQGHRHGQSLHSDRADKPSQKGCSP